jgi:hypothetical protein
MQTVDGDSSGDMTLEQLLTVGMLNAVCHGAAGVAATKSTACRAHVQQQQQRLRFKGLLCCRVWLAELATSSCGNQLQIGIHCTGCWMMFSAALHRTAARR